MAIEVGDWVKSPGSAVVEGEVVEVRGDRIRVLIRGNLLVTVHEKNVRIASRPQTGAKR